MNDRSSFFVAGTPATFATAGEKPWKRALAAAIPVPSLAGRESGITLRFVLPSLAPAGNPLDIDNLCEPLFSVLINGIGWFGSARPNMRWWSASKEEGANHGCEVTIVQQPAPPPWERPAIVTGIYCGILPRGGRAKEPAAWCCGLMSERASLPDGNALSCFLGFGASTINLGDVATGVIKSLIDCLYPLWGGVAGSPFDHRIDVLTVAKGVPELSADAVKIAVWPRDRVVAHSTQRRVSPPVVPSKQEVFPMSENVRQPEAVSNPCRPGSAKHVVAQAAIDGWPLDRVYRELDAIKPGSSRRLSEYISDVRGENRLDIGHDGQTMWCRGRIRRA